MALENRTEVFSSPQNNSAINRLPQTNQNTTTSEHTTTRTNIHPTLQSEPFVPINVGPSFKKPTRNKNISMYPSKPCLKLFLPKHAKRQHFHPLAKSNFALTCLEWRTPNFLVDFTAEPSALHALTAHVLRCLSCLPTSLLSSVQAITHGASAWVIQSSKMYQVDDINSRRYPRT